MDQRLTFVTLIVRDLGASRAFYVDGLGWTPDFEDAPPRDRASPGPAPEAKDDDAAPTAETTADTGPETGPGTGPETEGEVVMIRVAERVMLSLWSERAARAAIGEVGRGGIPPITLAHNVATDAEVDAVLETAGRAGAPVWEAQRREWGGYSGYFADPDMFRWEVAHLPGELGDSLLP